MTVRLEALVLEALALVVLVVAEMTLAVDRLRKIQLGAMTSEQAERSKWANRPLLVAA
tara:strand:- start:55218 stop:55391 length:174 start_codon:yes stop_codon:yes gene_type:complete